MSEQRPKGVIGGWYTLTSNFDGNGRTENREAGFTWQCEEVDSADEPKIDGIFIGYNESYRLATPEEIARAKGEQELTPYQRAVQEHMKAAPQELKRYVCGRLKQSVVWEGCRKPILCCGFLWDKSEEGLEFWGSVDTKEWQKAMATNFWQSYTQQPKPEATDDNQQSISDQLLAVAEYIYNHFDDSSSKTAKDYLQDFLSQ